MQYEFGGKVYFQEKLVWGQVKQLVSLLKDAVIDKPMSTIELIEMLGDKLPSAIAIVLIAEGERLKDKNLEALTEEIEEKMPVDMIIQVVEDFFTCNPTASILEKLAGLMEKIVPNKGTIPPQT
jgi:aminopeptidase C